MNQLRVTVIHNNWWTELLILAIDIQENRYPGKDINERSYLLLQWMKDPIFYYNKIDIQEKHEHILKLHSGFPKVAIASNGTPF